MPKRKHKKRSGLQKLEIGMAILMAVITILGIAIPLLQSVNQ